MTKTNFKKISLYKTPEESPGYLLWHVSTVWRRSIEAVLKPLNLTHPQFVVLATLAWLTKDGAQVSQATVAQKVGLDPNTTSQIIRGLEKKKFLKRLHSIDERSKNPTVTPEGADTLKKALPAVEQADTLFFSKITDSATKNLIQYFQRLTNKP